MYMTGVVPNFTAVFGIVMLLKPVVALGPVMVKDTMVIVLGWFDAIVTLDICEVVMFPRISISIIAPLSIVVGMAVANGVGVGDGVGDGVGVVLGLGVGVGTIIGGLVCVGDGVGAGANVAEMVCEA